MSQTQLPSYHPREFAGRTGTFLSLLSEQDQKDLAAMTFPQRFTAGESLLREGFRGAVFVVLAGHALSTVSLSGLRTGVVHVYGPEDVIWNGSLSGAGEVGLTETVRAVTDVVAVKLLTDQFRDFLHHRPAAALALIEVTRQRVSDTQRRAAGRSGGVRGRLADLLIQLADDYGNPVSTGQITVPIRLSQSEIAGLIGASLPSVARAFASLRDAGVVETGYANFKITDMEELVALTRLNAD